ncbi:hypothetical protein ACH5RR_006910 [Cinchona calisaya]|uniref:Uncharacterized protein n=1 Tax=Cinchona calisaya TaxID=153742 RepID=A0ABD3AQS7_9GENT
MQLHKVIIELDSTVALQLLLVLLGKAEVIEKYRRKAKKSKFFYVLDTMVSNLDTVELRPKLLSGSGIAPRVEPKFAFGSDRHQCSSRKMPKYPIPQCRAKILEP